ncbi:MAG: YcaQ family DNA glycosylase [Candidatus Marinimicrobia bacterium]|nr:YcaQ family DNA glycosylase [Candidatus Neomarinimicrobiota bacterium]
MKPVTITIDQACRLALRWQLLTEPDLPKGKEGAAQVIEKLGYVQIDTINVINRAHHHTLWTRLPDYRLEYLDELLATDRRVFEYWGHAASYLPMSDYRFYRKAMLKSTDPHSKWEQERLRNFGHLMQPVLERIRAEGPLGVKDYAAPENGAKNQWGGRKPEKVALEMLLWRGELMVTRREKFHRIYDLTERVLPDNVDITRPSNDELARFHVRRALQAFGIATENEICGHLQLAGKDEIKTVLRELTTSGELTEIAIDGKSDINWAITDYLENLDQTLNDPKVHFLSPFDNLIIQRHRTKRLFDFDYTLECYVPAAKRKWGYFVLPILWGDRLIGRLDPKADRKKKELIIRFLQFEPGFDNFDKILPVLAEGLNGLARFNECDKIIIEKSNTNHATDKIITYLASAL